MAPNKSLENVCSSVVFFKAIPATPLQVKKKYFFVVVISSDPYTDWSHR